MLRGIDKYVCFSMENSSSTRSVDSSAADRQSSFESRIKRTVARYFQTLNNEEFQATASLFTHDGVLYPPFESAITGQDAIAAYLESEAKGMQLLPESQSITELDSGEVECKVIGKVQTPLFSVNVAWQFVLNAEAEIVFGKVKLLAALEELLNLRF